MHAQGWARPLLLWWHHRLCELPPRVGPLHICGFTVYCLFWSKLFDMFAISSVTVVSERIWNKVDTSAAPEHATWRQSPWTTRCREKHKSEKVAEMCWDPLPSHDMCHQNDVPMIKCHQIIDENWPLRGVPWLSNYNCGQNTLLLFWILVEAHLSPDVTNA